MGHHLFNALVEEYSSTTRALRLNPVGQQPGLKPLQLRGYRHVDPTESRNPFVVKHRHTRWSGLCPFILVRDTTPTHTFGLAPTTPVPAATL